MKTQQGFTLIELIVVIVILGILAATALPKFLDVQSQAKIAALSGASGSISSAANLAHAAQLVGSLAAASSVTLGGANVTMVAGYPDAAGIQVAASLSANDWGLTLGPPMLVRLKNDTSNASCQVSYTPATSSVPSFAVALTSNGC